MRPILFVLALAIAAPAVASEPCERGKAVTISRDGWGIAHVRGRTDADAVFGGVYAQAEDDFRRVEDNYIRALGRMSEVEGETALWQDLRARLFVDESDLRRRHAGAPAWLRQLTGAWADALNCYLSTQANEKPRLLTRFEPWMALAFSEGSIGGHLEDISLEGLAKLYGGSVKVAMLPVEGGGSNGIAIAPKLTADGRALLLINPHTTHYFRSELQMTSDEGLDVYGAATWGQFFIYQGFNRSAGWMHTTSGADTFDEYRETLVERGGRTYARHGNAIEPLRTREVVLRVKDGGARRFTVRSTRHGPIVREGNGQPISAALMYKPVEALAQSFLRTKARDLQGYMAVGARYAANDSNNTVFADAKGNVALLLPQYLKRRDPRFDWTKPVDGSDVRTVPGPPHLAADTATIAPASGWIMNTNNWPYSAAGASSRRVGSLPAYADTFGENMRGRHVTALLQGQSGWTLDKLEAAAYDRAQPGFDVLIPPLLSAFEALHGSDARKHRLQPMIGLLRRWDRRWDTASPEQTLAVFYANALITKLEAAPQRQDALYAALDRLPGAARVAALDEAVAELTRRFGGWRVPWGLVNRLQRPLTPDGEPQPGRAHKGIGFPNQLWGSLATMSTRRVKGDPRQFGVSGNSFVAVVAFGPKGPEARAVTTGGASGRAWSKHFDDQQTRFAEGDLRRVHFARDDVDRHAVRTYRPGRR